MFYSTEQNLLAQQPEISTFFKHSVYKDQLTTDNGKLHYAYVVPEQAKAAVVICSGRIEGLEKYQELIWELQQNNYAVFIIDHQGQGRSYRALANRHKGYVNKFSDYADDFALFDQQIVCKHFQGKKIILGHSMGGAIAFDFLTRFEHDYSGVFLSAPMFDIHTKGIPKPLARFVAWLACKLGGKQCYAFGQKNYLAEEFSINSLTNSEYRYKLFREIYRSDSVLQLGGVTYGWLHTVFQFIDKLDQQLAIPLFIASAENDTVVDNQAQVELVHRQNNAVLQAFAGAKHELLFEQDSIRQAVLSRFYQFCDSLS
ncbi:MAG: alpha/beta fold hydrolase [Pseudoalteromonas prydzensis]|uniref:Alpha/beta fold hydrolase n=1 Tax=Pseudoalteromonas prydzensis TaxID=182141 RepID=A0ABR9FRG6_9GAMM|nr:alpha/beta fold hydrolase [Pseudoalteromonas prydzensis]MBE0459429.1 alpha/beta fold hydrolase [Pseudoalteromonas prydzensis]